MCRMHRAFSNDNFHYDNGNRSRDSSSQSNDVIIQLNH
jgi:hypothetical protein